VNSSPRALSPRQRQRRQAIINAVLEQLTAQGYEGLSMRNIALGANVSPTTLYRIYENKDTLVLHVIRDSLEQIERSETGIKPGLDRFISRLKAISALFMEFPQSGEAASTLLSQAKPGAPATKILLTNAIRARRRSLVEMQLAGELIEDIDINLYARLLASNTWGTVLLWQKGVVALQSFEAELIRSSILILLPAATRKVRSRLQALMAQ
jgi:TetR/AcrR family transcriptional regulator, cholesterol catabolism regulator